MWRDYDDDSYEEEDRSMDSDAYLGQPSPDSGPQQNSDTLKAGYPWVQQFLREHPGYEFVDFPSLPDLADVPELSDSRVALISTAGVYSEGQKSFSINPGQVEPKYLTQRFREMGDSSFRSIASSADSSGLRVAYPYLDTSGAEADINTVFPINGLQELEEESYIGSIARNHLSFMGYIPNPVDLAAEADSAIKLLVEDNVDLVLLTPADVLSHQTMAILQRKVEAAGIATISVALCRDLIEQLGVPRAVHYRFPFGYTFGDPNDEATQLRILREVLRSSREIEESGEIVDLPYEWMGL